MLRIAAACLAVHESAFVDDSAQVIGDVRSAPKAACG